MLEIIEERHKESAERQELCFYKKDIDEIYWAFPMIEGKIIPCVEEGLNLVPCKEEECPWWENYQRVRSDDDYYSRIEVRKWDWTEPAKAKCSCGEIFLMNDEFYGSCHCPKCNRWYTLLGGVECLPPEEQMKCEDW